MQKIDTDDIDFPLVEELIDTDIAKELKAIIFEDVGGNATDRVIFRKKLVDLLERNTFILRSKEPATI